MHLRDALLVVLFSIRSVASANGGDYLQERKAALIVTKSEPLNEVFPHVFKHKPPQEYHIAAVEAKLHRRVNSHSGDTSSGSGTTISSDSDYSADSGRSSDYARTPEIIRFPVNLRNEWYFGRRHYGLYRLRCNYEHLIRNCRCDSEGGPRCRPFGDHSPRSARMIGQVECQCLEDGAESPVQRSPSSRPPTPSTPPTPFEPPSPSKKAGASKQAGFLDCASLLTTS